MQYIRKDGTKIEFITMLEDREKATQFKHFKGNVYEIVTVAKDSENLEDQIVYQGQYGDKPCWTREIEEFFSEVDPVKYPDIKQKYRFEKLS